jgi:hypothetical protein
MQHDDEMRQNGHPVTNAFPRGDGFVVRLPEGFALVNGQLNSTVVPKTGEVPVPRPTLRRYRRYSQTWLDGGYL